jgi:Bax protein
MLLAVLFSTPAMAYQYGYYAPAPYSAPRGYYQPYGHAPYPYYRAPHRYSVQPAYSHKQVAAAAVITETGSVDGASNSSTDIGRVIHQQTEPAAETVIAEPGLTDRKQAFINALLPYIEQENRRIGVTRSNVERVFARLDARRALDKSEKQQIARLAVKYRLQGDPLQDKEARIELLRKIDIIPASMALAQAANESAWGESRFAREANNLFGIWTYDEEKGLKPLDREEGKTHLVRIFDDFGESVRYYMHTLNSHPAYEELRNIRQQLRESNQVIDGHALAAGLEQYSARGQQYIDLIQSLIRQNEWARLDTGNQQT